MWYYSVTDIGTHNSHITDTIPDLIPIISIFVYTVRDTLIMLFNTILNAALFVG